MMQKVKVKHFSLLGSTNDLVASLLNKWDGPSDLIEQVRASIDRLDNAFGPKLIRTPNRIGFDLALVFPYIASSYPVEKIGLLESSQPIHGSLFALVRTQPSGKIVHLSLDHLIPLEGKSSIVQICARISHKVNTPFNQRIPTRFNSAGMSASGNYRELDRLLSDTLLPILKDQLKLFLGANHFSELSFPWKIEFIKCSGDNEVNENDRGKPVEYYICEEKGENLLIRSFYMDPVEMLSREDGDRAVYIGRGEKIGSAIVRANLKSIVNHSLVSIGWNLQRSMVKIYREAEIAFCSYLDGSAFELASKISHSNEALIYSWLRADGDKRLAILREQAAQSYPILIERALRENKKDHSDLQRIFDSVDQSLPLQPALQECFDLPSGAVRSLQGVCSHELSFPGEWDKIFHSIPKIKQAIPPESWPSFNSVIPSHIQWSNFVGLVRAADRWNENLTYQTRSRIFSDPFKSLLGDTSWKRHSTFVRADYWEIEDMVDDFTNSILLPILVQTCDRLSLKTPSGQNLVKLCGHSYNERPSLIEQSLSGGKNLYQLISISDYWHKHWQRIHALVRENDQRSWPALFENQWVDGLWAEVLHKASDLETEGREMSHCVGSYANHCLTTNTHIVGFRDQDRNRVSTLEIVMDKKDDVLQFYIKQNYGKCNRKPSDQSARAAKILIDGLNHGSIETDSKFILEQLAIRQAEHRAENDSVQSWIGFDPRDKASTEAAWNSWSFARSRNYREYTRQQWIDSLDLQSQVELIINKNPRIFVSLTEDNKSTLQNPIAI